MKDIFISLAVIIGTIIGAGFASGREILNFFNVYGENGILGIILSSTLFGLVIALIISIVNKRNITEYEEMVNRNKILAIILKIFSVVCFCIMISGVGAFVEEQLGISFWIGTAFAVAISYSMFLHRFKGLEVFNCILVPLIIIGILIIGLFDYSNVNVNIDLASKSDLKNHRWKLGTSGHALYKLQFFAINSDADKFKKI